MTAKSQTRWLRVFRWLHRKIAIATFFFFLVIAVTGLLLGIKKQTGLLAPTQRGISKDLATWLSVDSLHKRAVAVLRDSVSHKLSPELDRIDMRPGNGIVKFTFKHHYKGVQLDATTGHLLSIEDRKSDFIEHLHDGSMVDKLMGFNGDRFKIGYTLIMGLSLAMLVVTGFWLWYGPKKIRQSKLQK
jgi:uncharacterized iron-regulated membrane protein